MNRKLTLALILFFGFLSHAVAHTVPHTGQTECYNAKGKLVSWPSPGQPFYGQDANYILNPKSYTKLGYKGIELPVNALHVDYGGGWIMTRDNFTGLIWEIKTTANKNADYTWSEAEDFIDQLNINGGGFGGFDDWRLPGRAELSSLSDRGKHKPAIETFWFPNTVSWRYWSSTMVANKPDNAWRVNAAIGFVYYENKENSRYHVRAVRGPALDKYMADNNNGTVTDKTTGLTWQKCTYGQKWDNINAACTGEPLLVTWEEALAEASKYDNWRLPNIDELQSLVDDSAFDPAICEPFRQYLPRSLVSPDPDHMHTLPYWSSTTDVRFSDYDRAWIINFVDGSNNYDGYNGDQGVKTRKFFIRLVRGGEQQVISTRILNWAEFLFPELLPVSEGITYDEDELYYRYYPSTGIYLGGYQGRLLYYHLDLNPGVYDMGSLDEYFPLVIEAGF